MKILKTDSEQFVKYGRIVSGYDTAAFVEALAGLNCPKDSVTYVAEEPKLQSLAIEAQLRLNLYGGLPVQLGYCNGHNRKLTALEYHRGSETVLSVEGIILLVAPIWEIEAGKLDASKVEAFLLPAGQMALLYETTLHYAPCTADGESCFHSAVVLPKGTNLQKPEISVVDPEDKLLWAQNKWLLAHPNSGEAKRGAYVGLSGPMIEL